MTSQDQRVEELLEKEAIKQLKMKHRYYIDHLDIEKALSCYAEDAVLGQGAKDLGDSSAAAPGHEKIRERLESMEEDNRQYQGHRIFHPIIDLDGDEASGKWYFDTIIVAEDGTAKWQQGEYHDEYRKRDGEWKIYDTQIETMNRVNYDGEKGWEIVPVE